jgi:hypothetical protein
MAQERTASILTGIAGVHFVVSEFSRREMIALATVRNTSAYDIVVISGDGKRHANIQVKTSSKRRTFWPMPPSKTVRSGKDDFYVLLRWLSNEGRYEAFMLTGRQAQREVRREERWQAREVKRGPTGRKYSPQSGQAENVSANAWNGQKDGKASESEYFWKS